MTDVVSNFAEEVRQYVLDVMKGKKKTEDKCLDNFAKAARSYESLLNKPQGEISEEELEEIEDYLAKATKYNSCGFGEIIDNSISQLKSSVEKLRQEIK